MSWYATALWLRYGPAPLVALLGACALAAMLSCTTVRVTGDGIEADSFARTQAVCVDTDHGIAVYAYPMSPTFAGAAVLLGAAIGGAVAGGPGAAAGAGVGAVVDVVRYLLSRPDPVPSCPGSSPTP